MEPASQLTLALHENKLQVGKRTDSHINWKKRKKKHTIKKSIKSLSLINKKKYYIKKRATLIYQTSIETDNKVLSIRNDFPGYSINTCKMYGEKS